MKPNVVLSLTIDEVNIIMAGLGKLPFEKVFQLIPLIDNQVQEQLKVQEKLTAKKNDDSTRDTNKS